MKNEIIISPSSVCQSCFSFNELESKMDLRVLVHAGFVSGHKHLQEFLEEHHMIPSFKGLEYSDKNIKSIESKV